MASESCPVNGRLRIFVALLFIPAFPLCLVSGILSHHPVPALGLLPQFFSIVAAVIVVGLHRTPSGDDGEAEDRQGSQQKYSIRDIITHPLAVFWYDVLLAAGYMIVLVYTWITTSQRRSTGLSMLAAYATMPLLASFLIHAYLALQAFYHGLAIHGLVQWVAWRAVPPNCPNCNIHLRTSLPSFPWLKFSRFFRRRTDGYAAVPAMEEDRYHDDVGEENGVTAVTTREEPDAGPEAVDIKPKAGKGKSTDFTDDYAQTWQG